ncbi:MAG: DUF4405 domain-containing protein [Chlorobiaceae bacterium]|nr:DUF4405 domain-containing protein [Chlorobiaceae bacterium]
MKSWATPLVIATFIISGVTGILMFFHKGDGFVKPVHEWLSWALVSGGAIHVAANWKLFKAYFTRRAGIAIISTGLIITVASITVPMKEGPGGNPAIRINKALAAAPLETLGTIVKLTPEQAVSKLEKSGLKVTGAGQSVKEIAAANGKKENQVLGTLFE